MVKPAAIVHHGEWHHHFFYHEVIDIITTERRYISMASHQLRTATPAICNTSAASMTTLCHDIEKKNKCIFALTATEANQPTLKQIRTQAKMPQL
jgi:hypothetical protein